MEQEPEHDWTPYVVLGFLLLCFFAGLTLLALTAFLD
jgi:hypothetical protein